MKAFSRHLLRHALAATWHKVMLHGEGGIRFERRVQTLLHVDAPKRGWNAQRVQEVVRQFGGWAEPCALGSVLLSFDHPLTALRAALLLQRAAAASGVSAGLTTGECTIAHFMLDGRACRMVLPPQARHAEERARRAPPATILVGPETYELVADFLADEVPGGVVASGSDGERLIDAATLAHC
jgi:hypothetical protein